MIVKYEQELRKLLKDVLFEDWMEEEEWEDYLSLLFKVTSTSFELMSKELEEGINKGFTLEEQLEISKKLLKGI